MSGDDFPAFCTARGGTPRPYDAWTVRDGEVEPCGSHGSVAAALATLGGEPQGGGVFVGRSLECWRRDTSPVVRGAILAALGAEDPDNDDGLAAVDDDGDDDAAAVPTTPRVWSRHQLKVFEAVETGDTHVVVIARAGSGKTTTIVEALKLLPRGARAILVAYNKAIATELEARAPAGVEVMTSHAYGFRLLRQQWGRVAPAEPDGRRLKGFLEQLLPPALDRAARNAVATLVRWAKCFLAETDDELAAIARARGVEVDWTVYVDPDTDRTLYGDADLYRWTREILAATRQRGATVDFDDMVYVPAALGLRGGYHFVFIDEAQDWNRAQVRLARYALRQGGRVVAVGDDRQAINGFRGADPEALPRLIEDLRGSPRGVTVLALPVTYRCPRRVADVARQLVPDLETPETAPDGEVVEGVTVAQAAAQWGAGDFVISRVNAPLVKHCLDALARGVRARIQGKDLGRDLGRIVEGSRAKATADFLAWLKAWEAERAEKYARDERDDLIEALRDSCAVLRTLADGTRAVDELRDRLDALFADEGANDQVVFTSAHRAKGLESDRVWLLRDTFLRRRRDDDGAPRPPSVEEQNLYYVAVTRARRALYVVGGAASPEAGAA